jgi:hypothetical protein
VLTLHCNHTVVACLYALQALTTLPARMSCRRMMAQVSDISVTCGHALKTHESSRIGRSSKPFFILEVCGPQRAMGHVAAPEPS